MFTIEKIRSQFPALNREYLNKQVIFMDGPGGTQILTSALNKMNKYLINGLANRHGETITSIETENHIKNARNAMADFLNANQEEIAFGQNATSLMFSVARALSKGWASEDNIVLSEIDHHSNIDSWKINAEKSNTEIRYLPIDIETLTLDLSKINQLIDESTKIVSVTLASNAIGTRTDIETISKRAKDVGALLIVDAVHAASHFNIDCKKLNIDILFCSAYKFFGPHIGIVKIDKNAFSKLQPDKVRPAPNEHPDKLETGTQNFENISSIEEIINFISSFGNGNNRREKIKNGFFKIEKYENALADNIREALSTYPEINLYQSPENALKTPTVAFTINGFRSDYFCNWLSENCSILASHGDFYASTLAEKLSIKKTNGWVRIGISIYNSHSEVQSFIDSVKMFIDKHK